MRRLLACVLVMGSASLVVPDATAEENLQRYSYSERHMGVNFDFVLYAAEEATANNAAKAAYRRIAELNLQMSDYTSKSELRRLCAQAKPGQPIRVSAELFEVLQRSQELSRKTDGAFDVTVGRLIMQWRIARRRRELPAEKYLTEALTLTGYKLIQLDKKNRTVEFLKPDLRLDLGGIAKGYAGDEALKVFKSHGITCVLVDAGGDIVVGDPPPDKDGWTIAVPSVSDVPDAPKLYLLAKNVSIATSGDAYQYVEIDGVRYSHIVNPKTGVGLTLRSRVTVIAPNGTDADSLASAVSVLGVKAGAELIRNTKNTELQIHYLEGGELKMVSTPGFEKSVIELEDD